MSEPCQALAIIGPTASGKTALALALAKTHPIEIISLDSALVYQNMDIGTAKPTQQELSQVRHHLIDIITPLQSYSAADFVEDALRLITEIRQRDHIPVIVGGTMMYFKALTEGLNNLPGADQSIRDQLQKQKAEYGLIGLYQQLQQVDPSTAARLKPTDSQRIERALEVYLLTGKPMSQFFDQKEKSRTNLKLWSLALIPEQRSLLHNQIALRFEQMLAQGFVEEVCLLKEKYPRLDENYPSLRCVGYRQVWSYLHDIVSFTQMKEQGVVATRQLAKRQLTWLRQLPVNRVVDPYQSTGLPDALALLQKQADQLI
jgi:tRNA dimethylallyltransferase